MLSADLRKLLIAQIGNELAAHQLTWRSPIYFERQSLDGWGKLFREQSVEEAQHAQKIIDFLIDNDVDFDLPALKATRPGSTRPRRRRAGRSSPSGRSPRQFDRAASVAVATAITAASSSSSGSSRSRSRRSPSSSTWSTSSRAASTCSRPRRSSTRSSSRGRDAATTTGGGHDRQLDGASTGRSTSPTTTRPGRPLRARSARGSGRCSATACSCSSTSVRRPCPGLAGQADHRHRSSSSPTRPTRPAYVPPLEAAGYVLRIREPDWYEHRVFKGPDTDVNLHIFSVGSSGDRADARASATGCGPTTTSATSTSGRSVSWPPATGSTSRTTPTPRARSSRRSSRAAAGRGPRATAASR